MLSLLVAATVSAVFHHLYLAYFDRHTVGSSTSQYWTKGGSNAIAALVQSLLSGSITVALLDVVSISVAPRAYILKY